MPDNDHTSRDAKALRAQLRLARQHAHRTDAERAETEARLHEAQAATLRANARAARTHAEATAAHAVVAEVRRLCEVTISSSIRVGAVEQATDTLALIESITGADPLPGDAAWHSVWLHGDWRWLTKNMTTPEREHAADAVARYGAHLDTIDGADRSEEPEGLRWWRD
jgi:multidrug efflux pump subunit AcrA (membrane-fusion protein)